MSATPPIELYDTTLRDGSQGEGINLSVQDKLLIAKRLDAFGIAYIEGGWPSSNPKDDEFFRLAQKAPLRNARLCAFGSTARDPQAIERDKNLHGLLRAETPVVAIFGKTWRRHSRQGLGLSDDANEALIHDTVAFLVAQGRETLFDAEHFFDGWKADREFALRMARAAEAGGASRIVLCDTNGGSLPSEIRAIVAELSAALETPVGIHAHNDGELAAANALAAVEAGAVQVQGTINGIGERCGNANLISIIPNLALKLGRDFVHPVALAQLTSLSRFVDETLNRAPNANAPFVGDSAFAHKGGVHVSAVMKDRSLYEHLDPKSLGNRQRVLISDLSGQSNIRYKARELGIELPESGPQAAEVVARIKQLEHAGYQFDGAEASFELILREKLGHYAPFFQVLTYRVHIEYDRKVQNQAILKVAVNGEEELTVSDGDGPVNALDRALRRALLRFYPEIADVQLVDYKVRVLEERAGTSAGVRVLIESSDGRDTWGTVGVSTNIIEASLQALSDAINYRLLTLRLREARTAD